MLMLILLPMLLRVILLLLFPLYVHVANIVAVANDGAIIVANIIATDVTLAIVQQALLVHIKESVGQYKDRHPRPKLLAG